MTLGEIASPLTTHITPHPVPLPTGEGTLLQLPRLGSAFPLPLGEGQVAGCCAGLLCRLVA